MPPKPQSSTLEGAEFGQNRKISRAARNVYPKADVPGSPVASLLPTQIASANMLVATKGEGNGRRFAWRNPRRRQRETGSRGPGSACQRRSVRRLSRRALIGK